MDFLIGHSGVRRKVEIVHAYELNTEEANLIRGYRHLSARQKNCVAVLIDSYQP